MEKIEINKSSFEFLWYSCFRAPYDSENKELICADRAYLDLCRTIKFRSKDENIHKSFRYDVNKLIVGLIEDMLDQNTVVENSDEWYEKACNKIIEKAEETCKEFHFGQAQKWLNMTIKYMLVMGLHEEKFNSIKPYLHVPVDNYIIKAAKDKGVKTPSASWSQWDYTKYRKFQKDLRKKINEPAIDWESSAWIKIANDKNKS
ncbi:MAG: hypothetical protein IJB24_01485 [Clostridia bacterium]|nr:hypothetical protein [Clostridia bacterium]